MAFGIATKKSKKINESLDNFFGPGADVGAGETLSPKQRSGSTVPSASYGVTPGYKPANSGITVPSQGGSTHWTADKRTGYSPGGTGPGGSGGGGRTLGAGSMAFNTMMDKKFEDRMGRPVRNTTTGGGRGTFAGRPTAIRGITDGSGGGQTGITPPEPYKKLAPIYEQPDYDTDALKAQIRAERDLIIAPALAELQKSLQRTDFANNPEGQRLKSEAYKNYGSSFAALLAGASDAAERRARGIQDIDYQDLVNDAQEEFQKEYMTWQQEKEKWDRNQRGTA